MKKIIHNIRKQSEENKRHILHILTFMMAIVLVFLWIYSLGTNLTSSDTRAKMEQDLKPFSAVKDNIVDGYNSLSEPNLGVE